jgi:hypothetical protein
MRRLLSALLLLSLSAPVAAEEQAGVNTLTPKEAAEGWLLLFDGATTFGWQAPNRSTWQVVEGMLELLEKNLTVTMNVPDSCFRNDVTACPTESSGWQPGPSVTSHAGWPPDGDYFASPPAALIGDVISAYTTMPRGVPPSPRSHVVVLALWALAGSILGAPSSPFLRLMTKTWR